MFINIINLFFFLLVIFFLAWCIPSRSLELFRPLYSYAKCTSYHFIAWRLYFKFLLFTVCCCCYCSPFFCCFYYFNRKKLLLFFLLHTQENNFKIKCPNHAVWICELFIYGNFKCYCCCWNFTDTREWRERGFIMKNEHFHRKKL